MFHTHTERKNHSIAYEWFSVYIRRLRTGVSVIPERIVAASSRISTCISCVFGPRYIFFSVTKNVTDELVWQSNKLSWISSVRRPHLSRASEWVWSPLHTCRVTYLSAAIPAVWIKSWNSCEFEGDWDRQISATVACEAGQYATRAEVYLRRRLLLVYHRSAS
jgi:hypothetical protein